MFGQLRASLFCFESVRWRFEGTQLPGQGRSKLGCAYYIQHALQVVNHGGQTDLCLRTPKATQQEAWISEDAVLQRGERMLYGGSS